MQYKVVVVLPKAPRGSKLTRRASKKPRKHLHRKPIKKSVQGKLKPRKKQTKKELWVQFGLVRPPKPRYAGLRGIVWHLLSLYVRARDLQNYGPVCVNCGQVKEEFHGGHFIAAGQCGWDGLVLDELNIHAECSSCNMRDKAKLKYAYHLDKRYGEGTAQKLRDRYNEYRFGGGVYKNWSKEVYLAKIEEYTQKLKAVDNLYKSGGEAVD